MQHDQAHAFPHPPGDALDDGVVDLVVGGMAPPQQHVGLGEPGLGAAVLGLLQGRRGGDDVAVLGEQCRDLAVHPPGVIPGDEFVLLLVDVFAPNQRSDGHAVASCQTIRRAGAGPAPKTRKRLQNVLVLASIHCTGRLQKARWRCWPSDPGSTPLRKRGTLALSQTRRSSGQRGTGAASNDAPEEKTAAAGCHAAVIGPH